MRAAVRRLRADETGFTLAETIVAFVLFGVLAASVAGGLLAAIGTSRANEARVVAANLATRQVEAVRGMDPAAVTDRTYTIRVDGRDYTVAQTTSIDAVRAGGSACDGASGPAAFKRVTVHVTWPNMGSVRPVRTDTVRSLPVTGLTDGTGVLTVGVKDRAGAPVVGQEVVLGTGQRATTRVDGCAVFPGLAPASTYSASITSPALDRVDRDGARTATATGLTVSAGQVTKVPAFAWDRAATLTVDLAVPAGFPAPDAVTALSGVRLGGPNVALRAFPRCATVPAGTPCTTPLTPTRVSVSGLFPVTGGYAALPGSCTAGTPPALPTALELAPGGTGTTVAASTLPVQARVVDSLGAYVPGVDLYAANVGCPGETYSFPGGNYAQFSLPEGTWRLRAGSPTAANTRDVTLTAGGGTVTVDVPQ